MTQAVHNPPDAPKRSSPRLLNETPAAEAGGGGRIVLDAYGGDYAPAETVKGAVAAARSFPDITVILTGPAGDLEAELKRGGSTRPSNIEIVDAPERVGMHEKAITALRQKKDSSISVGVRLVSEGKADAFVSAGNTGAVVAASSVGLGRLKGVYRPGIAVPMRAIDHTLVAIDVGANIQCKPVHLMQYGIMASVFARNVLGIEEPRVGLLNVGEEEGKGNELTRKAFDLLSWADIRFVGNVEGHDMFFGGCDIVVCEGFVGNALLKVSENLVMKLIDWFRKGMRKKLKYRIGLALCKTLFRELKHCADYSEYGGAPLLGVDGIVIIGHGRSDARAIENAIREARTFIELQVNEKITRAICGNLPPQ